MTIKEELTFIKKRNDIINQFIAYAEKKGFIKVESDLFEALFDFISTNQGFDINDFIKVEDRLGNLFLLRPDITSNIIKQVIPRIKAEDSLKMFYIEKIYAYNDIGQLKGKRQFGVEMIGGSSTDTDIELLRLIQGLLKLYDRSFYIEIGNQLFVDKLIDALTDAKKIKGQIKDALFKKNLPLLETLIEEDSPYKAILLKTLNPRHSIGEIRAFAINNQLKEDIIDELDRTIEISKQMNQKNMTIDLSLVSQYDYYNGPIFKGYIDGLSRDIFRGGRYDTLTESFGKATKALGFSLDLDQLIYEVVKDD